MKHAHTAAGWLRTVSVASVTGLLALSATAQFTPRASPEPLVRNVAPFVNVPVVGQTTVFATSLGGGMSKGIDDGATISWTPFGLTLPTTRLFSTIFVDLNTFYVATDGYGVQKSSNGGTSFTGINGSGVNALGCLRVRNVARIVVASVPTLFAGTDCRRNSGIWKSSDDGTTWSRIGVGTIPEDSVINTVTTTGNGSLMIAATVTNGLFRSTDAGVTWAPANAGIPNSPLQSFPTGNNIVCSTNCFTLVMVNVQGLGVYKSTDAGLTWTDSSSGLPASRAFPSGMNRDTNTVPPTFFVTIDGEGVYSSIDEGATWQIWGNTDTDPTVKYVRSVVGMGGGKYYVNKFNGVSRSLDSGATWYTSNLGRGHYQSLAHDPDFPGVAYGVSTTLSKIPNINAPVPTPLNSGIKGLMTNGAAYQVPFSTDTLFATTDSYGIFASDDRGLTWGPENTGLPELLGQAPRLTFDRVNQGTIYLGSSGATGIGMYKTTDGNWLEINTGLAPGPARTINRIIIDRTNPNTLYIATDAGVFKSTDAGGNWSPLYNPTDAGVPLPTAQIFQGSTPTELYIANNHVTPGGVTLASSGILKSINGGSTWTVVLAGRAQNLRLLQGDILIAGLADGPGLPAIKRSANKGATWDNISAGLTGSDIRAFGVAIDGSGLISASLEDGFYTFNGLQTIAFSATTYSVTEGTPTVTVTVTRTGGTTGTVAVQYAVTGGTATGGADFTLAAGTINFAAGVSSMTISIPITNDTAIEAPETIQLRLTGSSSPVGNVILGPPVNINTTVTITDNDSIIEFPSVLLEASEGGPNVVLTVTRSGSTGIAQAVTFTTANGTAMAGTDFGTSAAQVTGTITFAPGETIKTIAVGKDTVPAPWIRIIDDTLVEGLEAFTVTLSAPTAGASLGTNKTTTVTIQSNENGVTMGQAVRSDVNEGSGVIEIVVHRMSSAGPVHVNFACANGTATNGTHFQCTPGGLDWNDGESGPKSILVNILENAEVNAGRTFTVTLSGATGATLVAPMSTAVTIADNDNTVQFSTPTASVTEGVATVMLAVARTGAAIGQTASVTWTAADGSGAAGTDYGVLSNTTPPSGTLNWAAGDAASKTITIPILNNSIVLGARNFTVSLSAPVGPNLAIGANPTATVTINDDDKGLGFEVAGYEVTEGPAATASLKVKRYGPTALAASLTWTTVNGSAISGTDFGVAGNAAARTGTVSWAANDGALKTIPIPILNNAIGGQPDRTFTVNLTPGAGFVLVAPVAATVTIHDDDIPPQSAVQFSQPKYVVMENGLNAVLTVNRVDVGGGFGLGATVKYAAVPGTALAVSDYTAPAATASLSWGAGDGAAKTISIPIVNNTIAESPESFKVVLSAPTPGLGLGAPSEASVLILDDDEAFPLDGAIPPGFSTPIGVTKGWIVSNDPGAYEGVFTLKAEEIDDGDTAGIEMTGTFAAGNVSFRVKVSSEPGFDVLTFYVDGVLQPLTWSGTTVAGWTLSPTYPLSAGVHTLKWVYSKDASVSVGQDAVWIDALVTPAFTP